MNIFFIFSRLNNKDRNNSMGFKRKIVEKWQNRNCFCIFKCLKGIYMHTKLYFCVQYNFLEAILLPFSKIKQSKRYV